NSIKQKLSSDDYKVLEKYEKAPPKLNAALITYQEMEQEEWYIQRPDEQEFKTLSFKELQKLNLADKLPPSALIGSLSQKPISLNEHILNDTPFFQALNYLPALQESTQKFYL